MRGVDLVVSLCLFVYCWESYFIYFTYFIFFFVYLFFFIFLFLISYFLLFLFSYFILFSYFFYFDHVFIFIYSNTLYNMLDYGSLTNWDFDILLFSMFCYALLYLLYYILYICFFICLSIALIFLYILLHLFLLSLYYKYISRDYIHLQDAILIIYWLYKDCVYFV